MKLLELPAIVILTATLVVADNMPLVASQSALDRKVFTLPFLSDKGLLIPTILLAGTLSLFASQRHQQQEADITGEGKRNPKTCAPGSKRSRESWEEGEFQLSILHKLESLIKSGEAGLEGGCEQHQAEVAEPWTLEEGHSRTDSENSLNQWSDIESTYLQEQIDGDGEYDMLNRVILNLINEGIKALRKPSGEHDLLDSVDDLGSDLEFLTFIDSVESIARHSENKTRHRIDPEFLARCCLSVIRMVLLTFILFGITPHTNIFIALFLMYIVHVSMVRLSLLLDVLVKQSWSSL